MRFLGLALTLTLATGLRVPPADATCGRRVALFGAAACSSLAWPLMAYAADEVSDKDAIIKRAQASQLTVERVIRRAKEGKMFKPGAGISCQDFFAIRDIDDKAVSVLAKEAKAYKGVEKDLIKEGEPDVAVFFGDKATQTKLLIREIQEAQGLIRNAEAGLCQ